MGPSEMRILAIVIALAVFIIRAISKANSKPFVPPQNRGNVPPNPFLQKQNPTQQNPQQPFNNPQQPFGNYQQPQTYNPPPKKTPSFQQPVQPQQNYIPPASGHTTMRNYYCRFCGMKYLSLDALRSAYCSRNSGGGMHALYEGAEKSQYTCKYCGSKYSSIASLTGGMCSRHPMGPGKGRHEPAV